MPDTKARERYKSASDSKGGEDKRSVDDEEEMPKVSRKFGAKESLIHKTMFLDMIIL